MVPGSNPGRVTFYESGEKGLENRELLNSSFNKINIREENSINKIHTFNDFKLKSIYFLEQEKIKIYLLNKFSETYAKEMISSLKKVFVIHKSNSIKDINNLFLKKKINERSTRTSLRVLFNYLDENEILDDYILIGLRKNFDN